MTFDQSRNYFASATDADGKPVELMPAIHVEQLTRDQLAALLLPPGGVGELAAGATNEVQFPTDWVDGSIDIAAEVNESFASRLIDASRRRTDRTLAEAVAELAGALAGQADEIGATAVADAARTLADAITVPLLDVETSPQTFRATVDVYNAAGEIEATAHSLVTAGAAYGFVVPYGQPHDLSRVIVRIQP